MTRPLRSAPITGASPLLRAGPPARTATGAELRIAFAGHARDRRRLCRCAPSPVPFGRGRSGSRRLHAGHRLANTRAPARLIPGANSKTPVLMSSVFVSTRQQRFACARLPDPYLTPHGRLFLDRSPQQSSANAARGGLKPPPVGRLRRACLHHPNSTNYSASDHLPIHRTPFAVRDTRRGKVVRRAPDLGRRQREEAAARRPARSSRRRTNRRVALTWAGGEHPSYRPEPT